MGSCCSSTGNAVNNSEVHNVYDDEDWSIVPLDRSDLPDGWVAYHDRRADRVYYQNNLFKTTQWHKPLKEVPAECRLNLPIGWAVQIDKRTGRVYYQNHAERSTQWTKPELLLKPVAEPEKTGSYNFSKSEETFICLFTKAKTQTDFSENGECAVCFEELFENGPTVLTQGRRRVCRHFICNECAKHLIEEEDLNCPLCRAEFTGIRKLPDIRLKPKEWFDVCDQDGTGRLTRQELIDALTVILPIQMCRIEKDLEILWNKWDHDNTTRIRWDRAATTVIPYVIRKIDLPQFQKGAIPDLRSIEEQSKWFDYWDRDGNGILDKQELARGLLKTFEQYMTKKRVRKLVRNLLDELWVVLVGAGKESIGIQDFTKEDGFATTVRVVLDEAMVSQNLEEDDISSVEVVPALCPPSEQSLYSHDYNYEDEGKESKENPSDHRERSSYMIHLGQISMGEGEFHGYFTSPIATPKRLANEPGQQGQYRPFSRSDKPQAQQTQVAFV